MARRVVTRVTDALSRGGAALIRQPLMTYELPWDRPSLCLFVLPIEPIAELLFDIIKVVAITPIFAVFFGRIGIQRCLVSSLCERSSRTPFTTHRSFAISFIMAGPAQQF